jgi:hypothetical protein
MNSQEVKRDPKIPEHHLAMFIYKIVGRLQV